MADTAKDNVTDTQDANPYIIWEVINSGSKGVEDSTLKGYVDEFTSLEKQIEDLQQELEDLEYERDEVEETAVEYIKENIDTIR